MPEQVTIPQPPEKPRNDFSGLISKLHRQKEAAARYETANKAKYQNSFKETKAAKEELMNCLMELSAWQMEVAEKVLAEGGKDNGEESLSKFWEEYFQQMGQENRAEAEILKSGVLGLAASIQLLDQLGVTTYFPEPKDDVYKGIDLYGEKDGVYFAFQIKAHSRGEMMVYGEEVTAESIGTVSGEDFDKLDKFLNNVREASREQGIELIPFWIDLTHSNGLLLRQNETTGRVQEVDTIINSNLNGNIDQSIQRHKRG